MIAEGNARSAGDPAHALYTRSVERASGDSRAGRLRKQVRQSEGLAALRHLGYRIYFAGMLARGTAVWMTFVALPWLAVERGATPLQLGVVTAALFVPTFFISPFGGVLADRVNRLSVLLVTQMGAAIHAAVLLFFVAAGLASIEALAVFALLFGVLMATEMPVRQSLLGDLVPPAEVTSAVTLHATAWNSTRFLGPALAGVLIATVGVGACFVVGAGASILVALSILVQRRLMRHQRPVERVDRSVLGSLRDGMRFAAASPRIRGAMLILSFGGILGIQAFQTLAPLYVSDTLKLGGGAFGAFMAVWGAGALAGTFAVTLFGRGDRRRWLLVGATSLSVVLAILSLTRWPPAAFALAGLLGIAQISMIQSAMITVQQAATDEFRGRVMGLYVMLFQGTAPIGALLAGILAVAIGVPGAMLVGAAGLALVVLLTTIRPALSAGAPSA